jgi:hypothetical protein
MPRCIYKIEEKKGGKVSKGRLSTTFPHTLWADQPFLVLFIVLFINVAPFIVGRSLRDVKAWRAARGGAYEELSKSMKKVFSSSDDREFGENIALKIVEMVKKGLRGLCH